MASEYPVSVYGKRIPWEVPVQLCIQDFLHEGQCGLDVGANIGAVAIAMGRMVGSTGQIHAFEANPFILPRIRRDLDANGATNVTLVPRAVWTRSGAYLSFYCEKSYYAAASSLLDRGITAEETLVETVCLDEYCLRHGLRPEVIKIDVEGAEASVLQGAEQLLKECTPAILLEYCASVPPEEDPLLLLGRFGYTFFDVNLYKEVTREFYHSRYTALPLVNILALPVPKVSSYTDLLILREQEIHFQRPTTRSSPIELRQPGRYLFRLEFDGPAQSVPIFKINTCDGENLAYSQVPLDRYQDHSCSHFVFEIDKPASVLCELTNQDDQGVCSLKLVEICRVMRQASRVFQTMTAELAERDGTLARLRGQQEDLQHFFTAELAEREGMLVKLRAQQEELQHLFTAALAEREQLLEGLRSQLEEVKQFSTIELRKRHETIERLQEQHEESQRRIHALVTELADRQAAYEVLVKQVNGWQEHAANLTAEWEKLRQQLAAQQEEHGGIIHGLQVQLHDNYQHLQTVTGQLEAITRSRAWSLVQRLWQVRQTMRQGPAALALAPVKTIGRCLPSAVRAQLRRALLGTSTQAPDVIRSPARSESPLVSVVLPVHNQASLLRDSIQSVLAQSYTNFELIVVNDGSTDGVEEVLDEFGGHPKIRMLTQPNQKLPKALSNGFAFARGDYWTWTSADNEMHPLHLARQVAFLRAHPDVAMVYADYEVMDENGAPLLDPGFRAHNRRLPDSAIIRLPRSTESLNTVQDNFIGPCFLYRASVGRLLGEYDPSPGVEDYDYWMRLNSLFRIAHLDSEEVLYRYRWHRNSLSGAMGPRLLYDRTQELMAYEQARQAFYQQPCTIYADSHTLDWLSKLDVQPHTIVPWSEGVALPEEPGKMLLLVQGVTLAAVAKLRLAPAVGVAAWFGSHPSVPYHVGPEIEQVAPLCFASDATVAAGLALVSDKVVQAAPGKDLVELALKYADNHAFYERTRPEAMRQRRLPDPYHPSDRHTNILMQLDRGTPGEEAQEVHQLAVDLKRQGLDVCVLMLGMESARATQTLHATVPVLTLPVREREKHYRQLLTEKRVALVKAHETAFGADVAAELKIPFVQTLRSALSTGRHLASYRRADAYTTAYLCHSHALAREAATQVGAPPSKMVVLPHAIAIPVLGTHEIPYRRLFQWLIQGGEPAAARVWFRGSESSGQTNPTAQATVRAA